MIHDKYDLLPFPTKLDEIFKQNNPLLKPFLMAYIPEELLNEMSWTKDTRLIVSVEKGYLKIESSGDDQDSNYFSFPGELKYEIDEENF